MSPFVSESQRRYLWARHPKLAKRWADKYGTPKDLPEHKSKGKLYRRVKKEK